MENKQITFGKAVALRAKEIMEIKGIKAVNELSTKSLIPNSTLADLVDAKYEFPSTRSILGFCRYFNMPLTEFFDSPYFYLEFLQYKD